MVGGDDGSAYVPRVERARIQITRRAGRNLSQATFYRPAGVQAKSVYRPTCLSYTCRCRSRGSLASLGLDVHGASLTELAAAPARAAPLKPAPAGCLIGPAMLEPEELNGPLGQLVRDLTETRVVPLLGAGVNLCGARLARPGAPA